MCKVGLICGNALPAASIPRLFSSNMPTMLPYTSSSNRAAKRSSKSAARRRLKDS